jgi:high-affinity nickel permease
MKNNNFLKNVANLVKVKTIVTLIVIIVFAVLSLKGQISSDNVLIITSSVIAFYFGTQHERKSKGDSE